MTIDQTRLTPIAQALCGTAIDQSVLREAALVLEQGDVEGLLDALLRSFTESRRAQTLDEAIEGVHDCLERLMPHSAKIGGLLMAALYWRAGNQFMHHICDSIELWFEATKDQELHLALSRHALNEVDHSKQAKYRLWAKLTMPVVA